MQSLFGRYVAGVYAREAAHQIQPSSCVRSLSVTCFCNLKMEQLFANTMTMIRSETQCTHCKRNCAGIRSATISFSPQPTPHILPYPGPQPGPARTALQHIQTIQLAGACRLPTHASCGPTPAPHRALLPTHQQNSTVCVSQPRTSF